MLARLGAAFGHDAGQQRVVPREVRAQAALLVRRAHQLGDQVAQLGRRLRIDHAADERVDPQRAFAQLVDLEDHIDRDAVLLEVIVHGVGGTPAGVEQRTQVLRLAQRGRCVARLHRQLQGIGGVGERAEGRLAAGDARSQRRGQRLGAHRAGQHIDRVEEGLAPAQTVGEDRRDQRIDARECFGVDGVQPGGIGRLREHEREQLAEVGRLGCLRQQLAAQAPARLAPELQVRREAEVGQQRRRVDLGEEAAEQADHPGAVLVVALEHAEQLLEPQQRCRCLAGCIRQWSVPQPLEQPDEPKVPFGEPCLRIGGVQQRRQVPDRAHSVQR